MHLYWFGFSEWGEKRCQGNTQASGLGNQFGICPLHWDGEHCKSISFGEQR